MWLFTQTGFVSVVANSEKEDEMMVRARDKQSLQPFVDEYGVKILSWKHTDYPLRVLITRKQFVDWLVQSGEDLTYSNYKTRVSQTRGHEFAHPLHDVWATMLRLEDLGKPRAEQEFTYRDAYWDDPELGYSDMRFLGHS